MAGPRRCTFRQPSLFGAWARIQHEVSMLPEQGDKTPSGTGRIIPLNRGALETVKLSAQRFPNREPGHVFPAERYGACGDVFEATAYATDPPSHLPALRKRGKALRIMRE